MDKTLNTSAKNVNLALLNETYNLLASTQLLNLKTTVTLLNKLSACMVHALIHKLSIPQDRDVKEFTLENQKLLADLQYRLRTFISTYNPRKKKIGMACAQAFYLHADTMIFFEKKEQEAIPYLEEAINCMPQNRYYKLAYYKLTRNTEKYNQIRRTMSKHDLAIYDKYLKKRWTEAQIITPDIDIHHDVSQQNSTVPLQTPALVCLV